MQTNDTSTGIGVQILRYALCEVLVGLGKLAGGERFTSTGFHYDAYSASFAAHNATFFDEHPQVHRVKKKGRAFALGPFLPTSGSAA